MSVRRVLAAGLVAAVSAVAPVCLSTAEATSALQLGKVQYDSPGTDSRSNASLNAEYVTIKNVSASNRALTGFTVRDAQSHVYKFGTFTLKAGKTVRLHTGKGTNTSTDRYWGSTAYIWNNTGDKATVKNKVGTALDSCSWTTTAPGYKYC